MAFLHHSILLPVALACASLSAQEPAVKPVEQVPTVAPEKSVEKPAEKVPFKDSDRTSDDWHSHRWHHHTEFGAYAQAIFPQKELKQALDGGTGYGLGVQWTHEHGDWNASRTRLEWNTFAQGDPVAPHGTQTYAKNYLFSWDHLFKLNQGRYQAYAVGGIGGVRWNLEQTTNAVRKSLWTTKLAVTAGLGVQLGSRVNLEARYVVSSIQNTYDGNSLQASLGWHF